MEQETEHQRIKRVIGRDRLAMLVSVNATIVNRAVASQCFPSAWYWIIADELNRIGHDAQIDDDPLPRAWFSFKVAPDGE